MQGESYYFYGLFNAFVCYIQQIPSPTLPPGVPDNATFEGILAVFIPNNSWLEFVKVGNVNSSVWLQMFPTVALEYWVRYYVELSESKLLLTIL